MAAAAITVPRSDTRPFAAFDVLPDVQKERVCSKILTADVRRTREYFPARNQNFLDLTRDFKQTGMDQSIVEARFAYLRS
jgi:hypothetical protein